MPHDHDGFIPIDAHGCVRGGTRSIFAPGDGTDFPVKRGGIAGQQGAAVAEAIAKVAGAGNVPRPFNAVLHGELYTGAGSRFLRGLAPSAERNYPWPGAPQQA